MNTATEPSLLGRVIAGKYFVLEQIGLGGMGAVYRAKQTALDRIVAVKVMHRELAASPTFVSRFHREARTSSKLDHPNSVSVLDFGQDPDGLLYIAMEYVEGRSLHKLVEDEHPLSDARVVDLLSQVLSVLSVAHEMGIVHRDLKPDNVLVASKRNRDEDTREEVVKVCDFGIAKFTDRRADAGPITRPFGAEKVTVAGGLVGTPEFMSPEQARGDPLDARSDLYSVGVILYWVLTGGRMPFEADTALGVALKQVTDTPVPPSVLSTGVHPELETVCLRALEKRPEDRFANARDMRRALREAVGLEVPRTPPALPTPAELAPTIPPGATSPKDIPTLPAPPTTDATPKVEVIVPRRTPTNSRFGIAAAVVVVAATAIFFANRARQQDRAPTTTASPSVVQGAPAASTNASMSTSTIASVPTLAPTTVPAPIDPAPSASNSTLVAAAVTHVHPTSTLGAPETSVVSTATETLTTTSAAPPPSTPPPPIPSVVATAPKTTTTAATTTTGTTPPLDASKATVSIGSISATNGLTSLSVRTALGRIAFAKCYRMALEAKGTRATGTGTLVLAIDDTGHVTSAKATGADFLPGLRACIESSSRGARFTVDTGDAVATVTLQFQVP